MGSILTAVRGLLYLVWVLACLWLFQQVSFAMLVLDPVEAELKGDQCPQFASTCFVPARLEGIFNPVEKTWQVTTKANGRTFLTPVQTLSFSFATSEQNMDEGLPFFTLFVGLIVALLSGLWVIRALTRSNVPQSDGA